MTRRSKTALCSFVTVLSPLLMMYNIGIASLTLLDGVVIATMAWVIVTGIGDLSLKFSSQNKLFLLLITVVIINFIVASGFLGLDKTVLLRTLRLIVYLVWPLVIGEKYFDRDLAIKYFKYLCIFVTGFLIAQYIFLFLFNKILPGYVSFLPLSRTEVETFTTGMNASLTTRPRSLFGEPSQYGLYVTCYLSVMLLRDRLNFDRKVLIFLFAGMLLSRSTTAVFGVGLSLLLIVSFYIQKGQLKLKRTTLIIGVTLVAAMFIVAFLKMGTILSLIASFKDRLPSSFEHRTEGYSWLLQYFINAPILQSIFGIGMNEDVIYGAGSVSWLSSIAKILVYFGVVGGVLLVCSALYLHQRVERASKGFVWIMLLMGLFTELLVSNWLVLFLPFLYSEVSIESGEPVRRISIRRPKIKFKIGG